MPNLFYYLGAEIDRETLLLLLQKGSGAGRVIPDNLHIVDFIIEKILLLLHKQM